MAGPVVEKTVSNIEFTWYQVVIDADPELEAERHDEIFYDFATAGHRARNFYGDPTTSGAYAPIGDFSSRDFADTSEHPDFFTDNSPAATE